VNYYYFCQKYPSDSDTFDFSIALDLFIMGEPLDCWAEEFIDY